MTDTARTPPRDPQADAPVEHGPDEERHASWLELFFDLVVVAGIGALAHLLHEDSSAGALGLYVIAFTAFWLVWACFTTYANIRGERTRTGTMLVGMAALGVMVAAVPDIAEHSQGFAVAYVVGRLVAARPWRRGTVVVDLPVVQAGVGVVPWIVSWWFVGTTQHVLWAVGLGLDLLLLLTSSRSRVLADAQERLDRMVDALRRRPRRDERTGRGGRPDRGPRARDVVPTLDVAEADVLHLAERMSLFVLIVLGESLIQAIDGAAEATWGRPLAVTAAGAFALVVGLWALSVQRGSAGVALLVPGSIAPRLAWLAHLVATGAVATLAAVVATLTADPHRVVSLHDRTLVAVALGVYGLLAVVVHVGVALTAGRDDARRRTAYLRAACVGVPVLAAAGLAALRQDGTAQRLAWELAAGVLVALVADARIVRGAGRRRERRRRLRAR